MDSQSVAGIEVGVSLANEDKDTLLPRRVTERAPVGGMFPSKLWS